MINFRVPKQGVTLIKSDNDEEEEEWKPVFSPDELPPFNVKKFPTPLPPTDSKILIDSLQMAIPKMTEFVTTLQLQRSILMQNRLKHMESLKLTEYYMDLPLQSSGLLIGCYDKTIQALVHIIDDYFVMCSEAYEKVE
jgi:hypothetical protein